jgi:hypothetical protein
MTANQIVEEAGGSSKRRQRVEQDFSWNAATSGWQDTNDVARTTYGQEIPGAPTTAFYHADGNGNVTAYSKLSNLSVG